jgi:threonyl-tRNA synthetase
MKIIIKYNNQEKEINTDEKISAQEAINIAENSWLKDAIAVKVDNCLKDITSIITKDCVIEIITFDTKEGKNIYWHSSSHILSLAVKRLFKDVKFGIGPAIDEGFYYDFDSSPFTEEDLLNIEKEIKKIIKEKIDFEKQVVDYNKAKELFKEEPYKLDLIEEIPNTEDITIYKLGEWFDLCRGPHIKHTGKIKHIKLLTSSGAYWRGDSKNKQLQRIYGISFPEKQIFQEYLFKVEEAKKRDHRKIGKELDLFSFHEEAPGMPFFHNNGSIIYNKLVNYVTEVMVKENYEINKTPVILHEKLWHKSGHWDHYKENMYFTKIDDKIQAIKPMNCPGNLLIYKSHQYSYKDLPIRAGEFGLVHRHELSGVLSGLLRVRCFIQDDAHIFCTEDQVEKELECLINFIDEIYSTFGFKYVMELSTKPEKAMGDSKLWDLAETKLKNVLNKTKKEYKINEGDGAFYGPKIDFHLKDAIDRTWQCGTIQLDFQMPERFDLTYEDKDNIKKKPVMIHRAVIGSVERFMGVLIEHFAGKFPLWISPLQVIVLPIADRHVEYANQVSSILKKESIRTEVDDKQQTMNKKIRNAELRKINYIVVVGDKELENKTINIRTRENKILGEKTIDVFIKDLKKEIEKKEIK